MTGWRLVAPGYRLMGALLFTLAAAQNAQGQQGPWATLRSDMVSTIETHSRLLPKAVAPDGISSKVLEVMGKVPRHRFVPERQRSRAYADTPLPIGYGQTISQPFIVALMTHLLNTARSATVLEIGTGSGYQAAVLSDLVKEVCTIEIIPGLGEAAARRFTELGYDNVKTKIGDGYFGWPKCGPFDGILVTAAAGHVPPPLVEQLKPGGRMVIPVGGVFEIQHLTLVEKSSDGQIRTRQLLPVRFVPLTRGGK
ncbi:MAG: protein-L-isoaspartate(D-aspartate) O-methyltransferase [Hyphomicrobiaceae bacterium]